MSDILFSSSSEVFEATWADSDSSFSGIITSAGVQFLRFSGTTAQYLQSDLTTFSTTPATLSMTVFDSPTNYVWRYTLTLPTSMVGYNIETRFVPTVSSGDMPTLTDDFYCQLGVTDVVITQYKRDNSESLRAFSSGTGYVRGNPNFTVAGTKLSGAAGFQVVYNGVTYTPGDGFLTDSTTTWTWIGPGGTETSPGSPRTFTVSKSGSLDSTASIIVDRTAPSNTLAVTSTFGVSSGSPIRRGEYARWAATYSDANSGLDSSAHTFAHTTSSNWASTPALPASGVNTAYIRSSSSSPTTVTSDVHTATVYDLAGNSTAATASVFFTTLPTVNTVSGAVTSLNQSPLTLNTTTEYAEDPTAYPNTTISATITPNAALPVCRNSGTDNTTLGIFGNTLAVTSSPVAGAGAASQSDTATVQSQSSGLGRLIAPQSVDQNYRTVTGSTFGSFDYNANKGTDINTEPTLIAPFGGLNTVYAETLYDAYVPTTTAQRGLLSKEANISVTAGQANTSSASTNNRFVVRIQLPANNATNTQYGIKLRGPSGELAAVDGVSVESSAVGAGSYTSRTLGSVFTSTAGVTAMDVRVTIASVVAASQIAAVYIGVIA